MTTDPLISAFTNLGCVLHVDISLVDIEAIDTAGINLCLSRSVNVGRGDYENESHIVRFTWEELTNKDLDISALAVQRWDKAKADHLEACNLRRRAVEAAEAALAKRRRAARKRTSTKRELATLARLAAKHNKTLS